MYLRLLSLRDDNDNSFGESYAWIRSSMCAKCVCGLVAYGTKLVWVQTSQTNRTFRENRFLLHFSCINSMAGVWNIVCVCVCHLIENNGCYNNIQTLDAFFIFYFHVVVAQGFHVYYRQNTDRHTRTAPHTHDNNIRIWWLMPNVGGEKVSARNTGTTKV